MNEVADFLRAYKEELIRKGFMTKAETVVFDGEYLEIDQLLSELCEIVETLPRKPKV